LMKTRKMRKKLHPKEMESSMPVLSRLKQTLSKMLREVLPTMKMMRMRKNTMKRTMKTKTLMMLF